MKVLFAVRDERISKSIIKKYQQEYKEIISSKNVYYFNAILKELQNDKTYDRIVISEDLEPLANNNYEAIDNFIFETLDNISDEAFTNSGDEIPIILIGTDRRNKSDNLLIKIFGIGVYSALIGQDRSIDEVCKLINKPRSKKEAKIYYKIDSNDVEYKAESESNVSETEIQNILTHYKRLGKNEDRYVESFDSIASQYTDQQLKVIIKFLPVNVKVVLEESSPRYQQLVSFSGGNVNSGKNSKKKSNYQPPNMKSKRNNNTDKAINNSGIKVESIPIGEKKLTKPVIIPSIEPVKPIKKLNKIEEPKQVSKQEPVKVNRQPQIQQQQEQKPVKQVRQEVQRMEQIENRKEEEVVPLKRRGRPKKVTVELEEKQTSEEQPKKRRGRPRKNPIEEENLPIIDETTEDTLPGFNDIDEEVEDILSGFDDINEDDEEDILPGFDDVDEDEDEDVLPGFDDSDEEEDEDVLPGFDDMDEDEEEDILPGFDDSDKEDDEDVLSGFDDSDEDNDEDVLPGFDDSDEDEDEDVLPVDSDEEDEDILPEFDSSDEDDDDSYIEEPTSYSQGSNFYEENNQDRDIEQYRNVSNQSIENLLTSDKKVVSFIGTSKNGTSFLINNLAEMLSKQGIKTAILDLTKNRNAYYIYTKNEENLRKVAFDCTEKLSQGEAQGIKVNENLDVYTSLPGENNNIEEYYAILETLIKNYSLILLDCDFSTDYNYLKQSQEMYLVQSMDVLTIQPLTAHLRDLKAKGILDQNRLRIVINKNTKVRGITEKAIIGGMAFYNDPAMSFMTELFNRETIKYCVIPFEEQVYSKYLEGLVNCNISLNGYSKEFINYLRKLANMVYPLITDTQSYNKAKYNNPKYNNPKYNKYSSDTFSNNTNSTLDKMKRNY